MTTLQGPLARRSAVLALALLGLLAAGCAKKVGVDQLDRLPVSEPEGTRGTLDRTPSDLVVWTDEPSLVTNVITQTGSDPETTYYFAYRTGPGAIQGVIVDYQQSDGYTVLRGQGMRDSVGVAVGGGFRTLTDYVLQPFRRWGDRNYYALPQGTVALAPAQMFEFSDPSPVPDSLKVYVGRSVVTGVSSASSSLTNRAQGNSFTPIAELVYTGDPDPTTPLFTMSWQPVPGAAGYWIHVFETFLRRKERDTSGDDAIQIGLPSPIAMGGDRMTVRDWFIGYVPAPLTSYTLGEALQTGSRVIFYRVPPLFASVLVRVSAVDASGRMIATIGTGAMTLGYREDDGIRSRVFAARAVSVTSRLPGGPGVAEIYAPGTEPLPSRTQSSR